MKKIIKTFVAGILASCCVLTSVPVMGAQQMPNGEMWTRFDGDIAVDTYTCPIGWQRNNNGSPAYPFMKTTLSDLELMFGNYGGQYRAITGNANILHCWVEDNVIQILGKSAGTTTITLQKLVNGSWVNTDTCTVTVLDSYLTANANPSHIYTLGESYSGLIIKNRKTDATYTYTVDKPGLEVFESKNELGEPTNIKCKATQTGTYTLTITENYEGQIKEFQKVKMQVVEAGLKTNYITTSMLPGKVNVTDQLFNIIPNDVLYYIMNDNTPNHVNLTPNSGGLVEIYNSKYGETNKCILVQSGFRSIGFTNPGTCVVDVYSIPRDKIPADKINDGNYVPDKSQMKFYGTVTIKVENR